jgi:hypothetical protein
VIPVSYAALREATWEREREREVGAADQRGPAHQGGVRRGRGGGLMELCYVHSSSRGVYIVGKGEHPYPSTKPPTAASKGGEGASGQGRPTRETLTLAGMGQGWAPPFFFSLLFSLMGFFHQIIPFNK